MQSSRKQKDFNSQHPKDQGQGGRGTQRVVYKKQKIPLIASYLTFLREAQIVVRR